MNNSAANADNNPDTYSVKEEPKWARTRKTSSSPPQTRRTTAAKTADKCRKYAFPSENEE